MLDSDVALAALIAALVLDLAFGEPPNTIHPVAWMGHATRALVRLAPRGAKRVELAYGAGLALLVPAAFAAASWWILNALAAVPVIQILVAAAILKSVFAWKALGAAASTVRDLLWARDVEAARAALRSLCSRDASRLEEPELVAATVESVAENASDSIVAPLFFFAALGVPGAVFYRAVNTQDAMIGYHGETEYLGKAAARLDDLLNVIPARLTAALLLGAGALLGRDARAGLAILRRDGGLTESPNAGRPMAAMAGLLGVELSKPAAYRLGDAKRALVPAVINEAWSVVRIGAVGAFVATALWLAR